MSDKIKEEKSKIGKTYIIIALVTVIIGGLMLFKTNNNTNVKKQETEIATNTDVKEEKAVARIDFHTKLVNENKPQFEVYVDGKDKSEPLAIWMHKFGSQGYVVQKDTNSTNVTLKLLDDTEVNLVLRGIDKRDENNKIMENWVDYTSLVIDGKEILHGNTATWHNKPFNYIIKGKSGDEYKIDIKWQKHKEK